MKVRHAGIAMLTLSLAGAGCARITTSVVEKPRVDQELTGGNRGYLVGSAPPSAPGKSTRQILQTNVELATLKELIPWRKPKAEAPTTQSLQVVRPPLAAATPSATHSWEPPVKEEMPVPSAQPIPVKPIQPVSEAPPAPAAEAATAYTVKRGDTLDKIAAKVYGDSNQWRRIYQANKDQLASPNRIHPGQKLMIPPVEEKPSKKQAGPADDIK